MTPEELETMVKDFRAINPEASLILIPETYTLAYPTLCHHFELHDDLAWADYVTSIERMVNLSGKKLAKKKNLISQFKRAYPDYKVLQISPSRREVIIQFTQKWKREREVEGIYSTPSSKPSKTPWRCGFPACRWHHRLPPKSYRGLFHLQPPNCRYGHRPL
jgi:hypothetical protein